MPAQVRELLAIADEYGIPVLEDAAEALGSYYDKQALGTFGMVGVFSFNGNKILTTSGGGALVTNNVDLAQQARFLATQAKDPASHYQHSVTGYNYCLSNILAGIGRGQMELLDVRVKKRREIYAWYQRQFANLPALQFAPQEPAGSRSNRWLTTILLDPALTSVTPEQVRLHLETRNIEARPLWKPLHLQPLFQNAPQYGGNICEGLFERGLCLPSGSAMTDEDLRRVAEAVREVVGV
jgi:pyridoxal phosphate-dependent aminotransferase EpsN